MCYVRHRVGMGGCVFHSVDIYISINNLLFLNPAHRPQSRKGRLAAKTGRGEGGLLCTGN